MNKTLTDILKESAIITSTILAIGVGSGCAKRPVAPPSDFIDDRFYEDTQENEVYYDPFEKNNRLMLDLNTKYIYPILDEVSGFYHKLPDDLENLPRELSYNLSEPSRFICSIAIGEPLKALNIAARFLINLPFAELADVAGKEFGIEKEECSFSSIMKTYFPDHEPIFLVWPILGPTDPYRTIGRITDPSNYLLGVQPAKTGFDLMNGMNDSKEIRNDIESYTFDKYIAIRNAYYEHNHMKEKSETRVANK